MAPEEINHVTLDDVGERLRNIELNMVKHCVVLERLDRQKTHLWPVLAVTLTFMTMMGGLLWQAYIKPLEYKYEQLESELQEIDKWATSVTRRIPLGIGGLEE